MFHSADIAVEPNFDPDVLFDFMGAHALNLVSPLVPGSIWATMHTPGPSPPGPPRRDLMWGRRVDFVEVGQLTAFDYGAWSCWWAMLDLKVDAIGFGYDRHAFARHSNWYAS